MRKKLHSSNFSHHLFWDVPKENVNLEKHSEFIIKRVLEYGLIDDWNFIKDYYGLQKIVDIAKNFRELEPRALSYLSIVSKTPKEEFKCCNYQQLNQAHWNF
jgi:hypothetical protein